MSNVTIYSSALCGYCYRAKALLKSRNVEFEEIDVTMNFAKRQEMTEKAGGRTSVPQIFIGGQHVGGCDDLYALEREGRLAALLEGKA